MFLKEKIEALDYRGHHKHCCVLFNYDIDLESDINDMPAAFCLSARCRESDMNTWRMLRLLCSIWRINGAGWAVLRILCWPPSRARFDAIINSSNEILVLKNSK